MEKKKTAYDIILDRFLKDVEEKGTMPWQRPYERYNSFNYFTGTTYRGINRLLLPFGEYITKNQINQYNKDKGYIEFDEKGKYKSVKPEAYRFQKGIIWYPVVFFKKECKPSSANEIVENFPDWVDEGKDCFIGREGSWSYRKENGKFIKIRNILRYYEVADRKFFKNANGECLPSKIEKGMVEITKLEPMNVINDYIDREGISVDMEYGGVPCYIPDLDKVCLNPYIKNDDSWFSTAFHELAHSTGAFNRLNRKGVAGANGGESDQDYAKEECIAEIAAFLCCAETGIYSFETTCTAEYDNNLAYVQSWKKRIKDWGKEFIYIVSQADKAFNYICGDVDAINGKEENE